VADAARHAGDSPLGRFLGRLPPRTPFTLDGVTAEILAGDGTVGREEAIFLFMHQFDDLYLREQR
jgi:hypothetical protein